MPRKRCTFRARKPLKSVNLVAKARNKNWSRQMWAKRRLDASKESGAGVALSEVLGVAMCRRDRRNALRAMYHAKSLENYHPVHRANAAASGVKRKRAPKAA